MRNKLIAIVAASVLPLGFAATASATDPSAQHEVTFTVAEARSISVAVDGDGDVLTFGAIAQDSSVTLPGAVTVTLSSPDGTNDQVRVLLLDAATNGSAATPPTGVTLSATANTISGGGAGDPRTNAAVQGGVDVLYSDLLGLYVNKSFNVDFTLAATATALIGSKSYFILYTLFDDPLPEPED
jgi:hypothetical protein